MENKRNYFGPDEKLFLKELVTKYRHVLENKKTDYISSSERKRGWIQLAKEFNAVAENTNRTPEQLKKCWDNMKTRRRKELSEEKMERMATGGGICTPVTIQDENREKELHDLRVQEQKIKIQIAEEQLKQEKLKPVLLEKQLSV